MQIAVCSQNRKTITEHAGKCRKFWIYDIQDSQIADKRLVELSIDQSFHASHHQLAEPLASINVLITGSLGHGLYQRLSSQGVQAIVTTMESPDDAVRAFLAGSLASLPVAHQHAHGHGHEHDHHCHCHDQAH